MSPLEKSFRAVEDRIARACAEAGRARASVTLVAVSKYHPAERIREAYALGQRDFGENYAQELRDKAKLLTDLKELRWHFMGPIQRNKVKYLIDAQSLVHAVDRFEIAKELSDRQARTARAPLPVLVAIRLGGESSKRGLQQEALLPLVEACAALPGLEIRGLMTLPPPIVEDAEENRRHFQTLRELARSVLGPTLLGRNASPWLSMGMSDDLEVAISEGATHLRVGTALFGPRPPRSPLVPRE